MSLTKCRSSLMLGLAFASVLGLAARGLAQADPEESRFKTADGLKLAYQWYAGGKGKKSDCVILVHNYKSDSSQGPWTTLAKALQKQGYSVLLFDFRGHGKSADFKTVDKPELFCAQTYNKLSGQVLNPNKASWKLPKASFQSGYYPYLVNDLTAARRFLDDKNDAGDCNSSRVFIVAEQDSCPLVMLWLATEYNRAAVGPKTKMDDIEQTSAGGDVCGIVFLSWANPTGATTNRYTNYAFADTEYGSERVKVFSQIRKKVAMAFIYGSKDAASAAEARTWFAKFGIAKNEDAELVKYIREVPGSEKISGIKLLDIGEKPKDSDEKVSFLESKIVDFFNSMGKKSLNGGIWRERRQENLDAMPVPLDDRWSKPPAK